MKFLVLLTEQLWTDVFSTQSLVYQDVYRHTLYFYERVCHFLLFTYMWS